MKLDRGVYMERIGDRYRLRFYDATKPQKQKTVSLETTYHPLALERARDKLKRFHLGIYDPWRDQDKLLTVEDSIRAYAKDQENRLRATSLRVIVAMLNQFASSLPPNTQLATVTGEDLDRFIYRPGIAQATKHTTYRNLRVWLRWCAEEGYLFHNPIQDARRPARAGGMPKFLTVDQVDLLLRTIVSDYELKKTYIYQESPLWIMDVIELAACTGLRLNELRHLRWGDVIMPAEGEELGYIQVRSYEGYRTKTDDASVVPQIPRATAVLRRLLESRVSEDPDELVLKTSAGKKIPYKYTSRRFRYFRDVARLPAVPFHGLRHTFAVMCRMAGIDVVDLKDLMRHRDITTTMNYAKISREMLGRKVLNAFRSNGSPF